jgi:hypothetical protein
MYTVNWKSVHRTDPAQYLLTVGPHVLHEVLHRGVENGLYFEHDEIYITYMRI